MSSRCLWQRNGTISRESLTVHSLLTILIDVFHSANQSLDVDCLLPALFWSRRGFKVPRHESALSVAAPGEFRSVVGLSESISIHLTLANSLEPVRGLAA